MIQNACFQKETLGWFKKKSVIKTLVAFGHKPSRGNCCHSGGRRGANCAMAWLMIGRAIVWLPGLSWCCPYLVHFSVTCGPLLYVIFSSLRCIRRGLLAPWMKCTSRWFKTLGCLHFLSWSRMCIPSFDLRSGGILWTMFCCFKMFVLYSCSSALPFWAPMCSRLVNGYAVSWPLTLMYPWLLGPAVIRRVVFGFFPSLKEWWVLRSCKRVFRLGTTIYVYGALFDFWLVWFATCCATICEEPYNCCFGTCQLYTVPHWFYLFRTYSNCCGRGFASGARVTRHSTESPAQLSIKTLVICMYICCFLGGRNTTDPVIWQGTILNRYQC